MSPTENSRDFIGNVTPYIMEFWGEFKKNGWVEKAAVCASLNYCNVAVTNAGAYQGIDRAMNTPKCPFLLCAKSGDLF